MKPHFDIFDTTGDVGINIYGKSLTDIFEQAAIGLFSFITDLKKIKTNMSKNIEINADSYENLLINWLNELIFLFDTESFVGKKIEIKELTEKRLIAIIKGDFFDEKKHSRGVLIKAATYHKLRLEEKNNGWIASILFDI